MGIDIGNILKMSEPTIVHGNLETSDMVLNKNYNLIAKDGVYASSYNGVIRVNHKIVDFSNAKVHMDSLGGVKEGVEMTANKIPFKYYMMVLDYFRAIHKKQGTEAGVTFFVKNEDTDMEWVREKGNDGLIEDGDLIVYCPYARNTGSVHEIEGEEVYEYLRRNAYPLVEVHSHHTMGIQWSGVDDDNMMHFRGYTVFNHIYRFEDSQTRTYIRGEFVDFPTSSLFELPWDIYGALSGVDEVSTNDELKTGLIENLNRMASQIESLDEFPESWMERGKAAPKKTYGVPKRGIGFGSNYGNGGENRQKSRYELFKENMNREKEDLLFEDDVIDEDVEEDIDDELDYPHNVESHSGSIYLDDEDESNTDRYFREDGVWQDIEESEIEYDDNEDYRTLGS